MRTKQLMAILSKSKSLKILFTNSMPFYLLASRLAEATFGKIIFAFRLLNLLKAFSLSLLLCVCDNERNESGKWQQLCSSHVLIPMR